ncbi:MAG: ATP-binding cassette domain-containing protein [Promethearchaeota archaeon]
MNESNLSVDIKGDDMSKYDIEIFNLTKKYSLKGKGKKITALNNINLKIKKGEIFGLLGPNGAGKTTMVSILTTLIQPTSGYATILGYNILKQPKLIKRKIGLMLGGEMIYYRLTGYNNLKFFCKLYNIKDYKLKINKLAEKFNLTQWLNQYVEYYSTGMKVKLALARVLLVDPQILFLDEPMLGLDPNIIEELIEILINMKKTIFLTSHQMYIVQKLCDRIGFLREGEIIKVDSQQNFKKLLQDEIKFQMKVKEEKKQLIAKLSSMDFINNVESKEENIYFSIINQKFYPKLFNVLKNFQIMQFNELEPSLNDIFIRLSI